MAFWSIVWNSHNLEMLKVTCSSRPQTPRTHRPKTPDYQITWPMIMTAGWQSPLILNIPESKKVLTLETEILLLELSLLAFLPSVVAVAVFAVVAAGWQTVFSSSSRPFLQFLFLSHILGSSCLIRIQIVLSCSEQRMPPSIVVDPPEASVCSSVDTHSCKMSVEGDRKTNCHISIWFLAFLAPTLHQLQNSALPC